MLLTIFSELSASFLPPLRGPPIAAVPAVPGPALWQQKTWLDRDREAMNDTARLQLATNAQQPTSKPLTWVHRDEWPTVVPQNHDHDLAIFNPRAFEPPNLRYSNVKTLEHSNDNFEPSNLRALPLKKFYNRARRLISSPSVSHCLIWCQIGYLHLF